MAEYRNPSTPTARRRLIAVASIVTAFLIGFSVSGRNDEAAGPPASGAPAVGAAPSGAPDGPGPTGDRWGIPTGFARTEAGAVTAAVGYVLTGGELMAMPPTRVPDAIALIEDSWRRRDDDQPTLYGRFDFAFGGAVVGDGQPKMLEYNAETPTGLYEAAVVQWTWGSVGQMTSHRPTVKPFTRTNLTYPICWESGTALPICMMGGRRRYWRFFSSIIRMTNTARLRI